ncbi:hypothetical protein R4Z09_25305 [Niallia oryzisoli]|uniref:Transcriptional regulator n=1 Tax=Niallia oryzisoli TaxID=1737571 RepID=A0ABZ2CFD1_9BACI
MFRIGIVGPSLSVDRILEIAREMEQEMEFIPLAYNETSEVKEIILSNDQQVDFWLFSGYIPYTIAKKLLPSDEKLVYIFFTESSIYKGIMELSYSQGKLLNQVSIDMVQPSNIAEGDGIQQLKMTMKDLYLKTFDAEIDPNELFHFHYDLWKQQKTEGALTCFPTVNQALKEAGVPTYWMSPTRIEIFQTIRIFFEKIKTSYYKETQIGVVIIEVLDFDQMKEKMKKPYQIHYLELRFKELLIQLCENLGGSLFEQGNGRYTIFSSRGVIEREIQTIQEKIEGLSLESNTAVAAGVGFGETLYFAEMNAHRALRQSKEKEAKKITIIQDDGTMIESVGEEEELTYFYRTDDKDFLEKLNKGNISVKTYKKIEAFIRKKYQNGFTTKDLAIHLQMSERYAQKIVADLCKVDLAEYIGEESPHSRGRPIKVYKLK